MANPQIKLKRSSTQNKRPTPENVPLGELALNTYDGYLYASKNVGVGTTVITVNPWRVGTGTDSYNIDFTAGNVGINSASPTALLDVNGGAHVSGNISIGSTTNIVRKVTDINSWVIKDTTFSVSAQQSQPFAVYFKPDGTKMFITGSENPRDVEEYALSSAWDITSASHTTAYSVSSQDTSPQGLFFSPNGENMFIVGAANDNVYHYTLSTGWDLTSTVTYVGSFDISSQDTIPTGLTFGDSGTKMYVVGRGNDNIYQYNLSSAYTITSGVSLANTLDISATSTIVTNGFGNPHGISISSDGTKIWIVGTGEDRISQINLSTAYDLSTASYNSDLVGIGWYTTTPNDLYINESAGKAFVVDSGGDDVHEVDITTSGLSIEANPTVASANINLNNNVQIKGETWFDERIIVNGTGTSWFQHNVQIQGTLTLRGIVDISDGPNDRIQFGGSDDAKIYYDGTDNFFDLVFSSADNNGLRILDSSESELLRVTNDGKVGINSASPTAKLDVNGDVNISGVVTATSFDGNLTGFDELTAPHSSTTKNYAVTVASKSDHRYQGTGSGNAYYIDGVESPILHLTPGRTYRFELSSTDMTNHPFRFYLDADRTTAYTTNVTSTPDSYTEITITDSTPAVIHYQCSSHGYMGNAIITHSNAVNTPYLITGLNGANITGVVTATSFSGSGSSLTGIVTGIQAGDNITILESPAGNFIVTSTASGGSAGAATTITLADESTDTICYPIFATDPTGDQEPKTDQSNLLYNSSTGALTAGSFFGDGSTLTNVLSNVSEDTTPQLGGNLGINGNNITGTGNIDITGSLDVSGIASVGSAITMYGSTGIVSATEYYGDGSNLSSIVTQLTAGTGIVLNQTTGNVTITASGGGGDNDPTTRTTNRFVATASQSLFTVSYSVGYVDVFLNGSKLDSTEYTATNGTSVSLTTAAAADDIVEIVAYESVGIVSITSATQGLDVTGHLETDTLRVSGVSTFQNDVHLGDNDVLKFGDHEVFEIYSTGTSSIIKETGSGNLKILGNNILLKNAVDSKTYADFNNGGSVELYYDNSKKFETTGAGVTITGIATATSFVKSSNSGGFLKADGTEDTNTYLTSFTETNDLSSAVTWANVPDANITESSVTQHEAALSITESQISDLQSYLTSYTETQTLDDVLGLGNTSDTGLSVGVVTATSFVKESNSGGFLKADGTEDTSTYFSTTGNFTKDSGSLAFKDNVKVYFGDSSQDDSTLYHDGTDTRIENRTGDLVLETIDTGEGGSGDDIIIKAGTGKTSIFAHNNGAVELWNNGSKKLETTGAGVTVTGILTATSFSGDGSNITGISTLNITDYGVGLGGGGGGDTVTINATATDILSVSSGDISADDAGADKLVFWDDSESKLTYLTAGSGLSISGTTITATGGGGSSGIEIENSGSSVGTAITAINFSTNLTATASGGIATITSGGAGGNPVSRSSNETTATAGQTVFNGTYTTGFVDVFLNGSKLDSSEFTATNGTSITLTTGATANDIIEIVGYTFADGSTNIELSEDTTPELSGNLDLKGFNIVDSVGGATITATVAGQLDALEVMLFT